MSYSCMLIKKKKKSSTKTAQQYEKTGETAAILLVHWLREVLVAVDLWIVLTNLKLFTVELSVFYRNLQTHKQRQ